MTEPDRTRILVCEDQPLVRASYVTVLSSQPDLEVVGEAADGVEAVERATRLQPDLAIMDIRMPRLNGIEAARRLAGPESTGSVKVLVVTHVQP